MFLKLAYCYIGFSLLLLHILASSTLEQRDVRIYSVDDNLGYGRRFDGIGGISGTATSKLLRNYPDQQRNEILDFLFKPNFGASIQILKVEVGADADTTVGTESSHMHYPWDENYNRGYEWWMMSEAKKRNPNIKLYGLPWGYPGWLRDAQGTPWGFPNRTATYMVKWIRGAKLHHNLDIDYIGLWNERPYSVDYIKIFRSMLDAAGFNNTMILGSDNHWDIAEDILKDPELAKAVSVIGAHFPGTFSTDSAVKTNKTLWASADYSTFNDEVGGGCWARILNQNYVNGLMTATISWNLIASYYFPLPFYEQGLMTAMEPWSGHYEVKSPIWVTAHTSQFTDIGWDYLHHDHGVGLLDNGGSYVALTSPDRKQLTIVIETMTHDHSICIRPGLPSYQVGAQSFSFQLNGSYANIKQFNVWHSKPGFYLKNSTFFVKETPLQVVNGMVSLDVGVDEVITLTTVDTGVKGSYPESPISKSFPLPYTEDFEGYDINGDAYNLAQQTGAFEVLDHDGNKVLQQMVLSQPVINCGVDSLNTSLNLVGSYYWTDISISIDVLVSGVNTTDGVYVGARINLGACKAPEALGLYFYLYPKEGRFSVFEGFLHKSKIAGGKIGPVSQDTFTNMKLTVKNDLATGYLNNKTLFVVRFPDEVVNGFVGFGTRPYGLAKFDNLKIEAVPGGRLPGQPS